MEVTHRQIVDMIVKYETLLLSLPDDLAKKFPSLSHFLSPANFVNFRFNYFDTEDLSITEAKRWRMLESPHARTLLLAWALQHFTPENDNANADHHL